MVNRVGTGIAIGIGQTVRHRIIFKRHNPGIPPVSEKSDHGI